MLSHAAFEEVSGIPNMVHHENNLAMLHLRVPQNSTLSSADLVADVIWYQDAMQCPGRASNLGWVNGGEKVIIRTKSTLITNAGQVATLHNDGGIMAASFPASFHV